MHVDSADALVIGAGPAGLSASLYLARYNRSVLVFDGGHGRSTHHQRNMNYVGFPGGIPTIQLREIGRKQLEYYEKVTYVHRTIERLSGNGTDGFVAHGQGGATWHGRVVVLATGVVDHWPHFHGWEAYVGISIFWCITCDGYESRGKDIIVAGHTDDAASEAMQLHSLTDRVRLLTNSDTFEIGETFQRRLANVGIPVIHDKLDIGVGKDGQLDHIITKSGLKMELDRLFSIQGATPENKLAIELGVAVNKLGYVMVDTEQTTNVPGVYAAGDISNLHQQQVSAAVHEGAQAGSAANYFLYPPELKDE